MVSIFSWRKSCDFFEQFRKMLDYAQAGDNVGLLLRGVDRNDVSRGDILTK